MSNIEQLLLFHLIEWQSTGGSDEGDLDCVEAIHLTIQLLEKPDVNRALSVMRTRLGYFMGLVRLFASECFVDMFFRRAFCLSHHFGNFAN